ncbi:hypothetical protein PROFUN_03699 [Planoprotostelium fungivorum]|uniref:Chitin-binding type-4 domain-containing protein n=1 Tax=Planoprotostelium fungivorum TaxID=1890364 RepID=A0A2P6NDH6_9EUKA|nr:hypothetical protein PROFUN_03699 [Planoprotostelium fungivorum]
MTFRNFLLFLLVATIAADVCSTFDCGLSSSCCPDHNLGAICYNETQYRCAADNHNAKSYLCALDAQSCNGTCFDPKSYKCNGGKLSTSTYPSVGSTVQENTSDLEPTSTTIQDSNPPAAFDLVTPAASLQPGLTLINKCGHTVRICGAGGGYIFELAPQDVGNIGNPAYNQCGSVQIELRFNGWNHLDWYDLSEVAIHWSSDPVQLIPPFGARTLFCTHRGCSDAYQYSSDDTKTHSIRTGGAFVAQFC